MTDCLEVHYFKVSSLRGQKMRNNLIEAYVRLLMETSNPTKPLWNQKQIEAGWNVNDGCMLKALLEFYRVTKNQLYLDYVVAYTNTVIQEDGSIPSLKIENYSLDDFSESRILFDLYEFTNDEKYKNAIEYSYEQLLNQPRTYEGAFWHKARCPHQMWLDDLFMGQVFNMRYETKMNQGSNYSDIQLQYEIAHKQMYDAKTGLYHHAYDASKNAFWCDKETGLSLGYHLRACGWFVMSLVEVLANINPTTENIGFYQRLLSEAIVGLLAYQDPKTKLFYNVPNQPNKKGNYLECSGSAMIAYTLMKGARLKLLPDECHAMGAGIFKSICEHFLVLDQAEIHLTGICSSNSLGGNALANDGSFDYYCSLPVISDDARGVGPFLLAYLEMIR